MKNSLATLNTVAEKAGVSVMTASRALSGTGYVAKKTRAKVIAAAQELNYSPNLSAKMMKGSGTGVIGVLVNDLNSVVINEIVGAVSSAIKGVGRDLIIYNSIDSLGTPNRGGVNQMLSGLCDGLLLIMPRLVPGHIEKLEKIDLPMVLVNYCRTETSLPVVRGDNRNGARDAVNHLLALGHRRIGFLAGSGSTGQSQERQRGYTEALKQAGIATDKNLIVMADFKQNIAFELCTTLFDLADPPTAIFAANDAMALGAIDAARAHGLRVPEDISVVGFDDIPLASHVHPKLTTLRQPLSAIGDAAVQELLRRITGAEAQQWRVEFPSTLIVRETTAPPATTLKKLNRTNKKKVPM